MLSCAVRSCIYAAILRSLCPRHDFALNAPQELRDDEYLPGGQEEIARFREESRAAMPTGASPDA